MPIGWMSLPVGYIRMAAQAKGITDVQQAQKDNERKGAYFTGLSGLSADAREAWEKQYLNEISGLSDSDKDEVFRNTVFKDLFKDSEDPGDQEIWNNRNTMSLWDRDRYVARKAVEQDLDGISDDKEGSYNLLESLWNPAAAENVGRKMAAKLSGKTLREEASDYLAGASEEVAAAYRANVQNMDASERENLADNFDSMSKEWFPNYREYIETDKLDLSPNQLAEIAANFTAWQQVGGDNFAYRMLSKTYQDTIAKNQSLWEKTVNTGAQFVDSGAGMIIRAAGMLGGLATIGLDEDESYWDNVLDNAVTRYGDRVATTQSWSTARQKYLEENGLQDNPILNTQAQENALVSWNTPFEVLGQYGFTAASTILSFGGSAAIQGTVKVGGAIGKAANAAKGLNTTAKGIRLAKGLIRAKDAGNILVAAGVGTVEGGMNAVATRDKTLKDLNADIDRDYNAVIDYNIESFVKNNPEQALQLLAQTGTQIPQDITVEDIAEAFKYDDGVREYFANNLPDEVKKDFEERKAQAERDARSSMMVDFIGNSIINGFINTTFQATLNAPSIQRSLRKVGLQKSAVDDMGIRVVKGEENAWKAAAKRYTKWDAVKNRFREAWGEGIEEYTQNLSGAFGEGYGKDKMSQWLDYKYGDSEGSDAFEEDVFRNFLTGLEYMGEAAGSQQAIKEGLYGFLSTAVGGPNANLNNRGTKGRQENESGLDYAKRRSLVTWRSALGPIFNNEAAEVNEKREKTAQLINDFLSDPDKQSAFFELEGATNWMRRAQAALQSGDEKAIRDARVAELVSTIFTANTLRGSGYYDALQSTIQGRANFKKENLDDPESTESKAVDQYLADVRNRGENISREEAFDTIVKSANDMLSMMDSVEKESAAVEKLFGSEIDSDTKEALVYARVSANDAKSRMEALDKEIATVTSAISSNPDNTDGSGLSQRSRRIIARFGSLVDSREARREAKAKINQERQVLKVLKEDSKELGRAIDSAKKDIARYRREAPKETTTSYDAEGNEVKSETLSGREVLSAREIMALSSVDRAYMLNPKNRSKYSQAQQAEIEKVELAGSEQYEDFTSKVVDRGRLESDYTGIMRTLLKMTQEPQTFARYQQAVKEGKQRQLLNKKYEYLKDFDTTKSYAEFASELTRIFENESNADRQAAIRVLNMANSAYYARYKEANDISNNIYGRLGGNEAYNKLDDNSKNLFANTVDYLISQGVDIEDANAVVEALEKQYTLEDGSTVNAFAEYVADTNTRVKDNEKAVFTSTGEVIQNFKDVMKSLRREAEEQASNARPVEVQSTTPEQSAPTQAPQPQQHSEPGIFGQGAYKSADEGFPEGSTETPEPAKAPASSPVEEAFQNSSGDNVAKAASVAINTAKNTPSHVANSKAVNIAVSKIEGLQDVFFESTDDFADEILKEANILDQTGEADNQAAAGVLRRAAASARNQSKMQTSTTGQKAQQSPLTGLASRRYAYTQQFSRTAEQASPIVNSATVSTLDVQKIKKNHPDGALAKFLTKYKVEEFLSNPEALTGERRIIKFIVDSQLAADTKQSMESAGQTYTKDAIPVVPVVEVNEKSDHVIVVVEDGKEHYYQPVGILPATYNTYTSGANRLGKLREFASVQEENTLIKDDKGNVISSAVIGHVTATPPQHLSVNQSVLHIGMKSLTVSEQSELRGKSKEEARKTAAYERLRQRFLDKLTVRTNKYGSPELFYSTSNLKNDGNESGFNLYRTPVHLSIDKNSTTPILDLFKSEFNERALASNSRIKRFASTIQGFFDGNVLSASAIVPDGKGGRTVSQEGQASLDRLADKLGAALSNYLVLPTKMPGGPFRYRIVPKFEGGLNVVIIDGKPVFTLILENAEQTIPLTDIVDGQVTEREAFETLKHLFLDENNQPRMRSDRESFMIWQIPYNDIREMKSNSAAKANVIDIYDDGIIEASVASFDYTINSVQFNAPFTVEGLPAYPTKTVANQENAGIRTGKKNYNKW